MQRIFSVLLFTVLALVRLSAQADTLSQIKNAKKAADNEDKNSLYTLLGYGSLAMYPGSELAGTQKYAMASAIYSLKNRFFVSAAVLDLTGTGTNGDFLSTSLIYNQPVTNWFDLTLAVTGFKPGKDYPDTLMKAFVIPDVTTGFSIGKLRTDLSFSCMYSGESNYFLQLKTSRLFQTPSFFKKKVDITFNPYIKILAGSRYNSYTTLSTSSAVVRDSVRISLPTNSNSVDENGNRIPDKSAEPVYNYTTVENSSVINTYSSTTTVKKNFGLIEGSAGLPVSLNFRRFSVEAEAGYVLPLYSDKLIPRPQGFVFMVSAMFKIF